MRRPMTGRPGGGRGDGAHRDRASSRAGASLAEALVVLVLAALLVHLAWTTLREQSRAARRAAEVADRLEVARAGRFILDGELRAGVAGRDWTEPRDDTLAVRAFRGLAVPCLAPTGGWNGTVRYRGVRRPDPAKDSVLILEADGGWRALALDDAWVGEEPPCSAAVDGPEWTTERWGLGEGGAAAPEPPVVVRLFEHGSYHLADGALRYRRGRAGRQPLTPELLDDEISSLVVHPDEGLLLRFGFRERAGGTAARPWETTVRAPER